MSPNAEAPVLISDEVGVVFDDTEVVDGFQRAGIVESFDREPTTVACGEEIADC